MILIKAETGKSVIIETIQKGGVPSLCYSYYEDILPISDCYLNSTEYSINELCDELEEFVSTYEWHKNGIRYFIIYTNEKENDLDSLFYWISKNEGRFDCYDVIVTCR